MSKHTPGPYTRRGFARALEKAHGIRAYGRLKRQLGITVGETR